MLLSMDVDLAGTRRDWQFGKGIAGWPLLVVLMVQMDIRTVMGCAGRGEWRVASGEWRVAG
jgi:hypothetical protein